MKEIPISKFKAQCLRLLDEVNRTGEGFTITRNGQPLVVVNPIADTQTRAKFGIAKKTGKIVGDLITPAIELSEWEILSCLIGYRQYSKFCFRAIAAQS